MLEGSNFIADVSAPTKHCVAKHSGPHAIVPSHLIFRDFNLQTLCHSIIVLRTLSHTKRTSDKTYRDKSSVQESDKRNALFIHIIFGFR